MQKTTKEIASIQTEHYDFWPDAKKTPIHELLADIPASATMIYEWPDGAGHSMIPVGRLCADALAEIRRLNSALYEIGQILNGLDQPG